MPSFSQSLEQTLHRAFALAKARHHQNATPEHLLLSLVEDPDATKVFSFFRVDLDVLKSGLHEYIESELVARVIQIGGRAS
jgi:ATP-dependent Clp protease ATP-binding subunit ClpA